MNSKFSQLPNMYFRKRIGMNQGEISMDAQMIRLLLAIDESKSMAHIAKETGMSLPDIKKTLSKLLKLKLVEPVDKGVELVSAEFIGFVRSELIKAVGPIGEFLIEDIAADMGYAITEIPTHRAPELISQLAEEIPQEDVRLQFKRSMIAILSK